MTVPCCGSSMLWPIVACHCGIKTLAARGLQYVYYFLLVICWADFFLPETNEYKVISNGQFIRLFQNSRFYVCPCFSWSHMHTCMVRCMHLFLNNLYIGIDVAKLALACNFDYADLGSKKASERIMQRQLPQHVLTSFV